MRLKITWNQAQWNLCCENAVSATSPFNKKVLGILKDDKDLLEILKLPLLFFSCHIDEFAFDWQKK